MADAPPWNPTPPDWLPPAAVKPRPRELLFAFVRARDHMRFRCELLYHGEYGVEAQFFMNEEYLLIGRRFDTKALAVQWAELERQAIERDDEVFNR